MATIAHVNRAPVAALAGPVTGDERSPVTFSAAGSSDPDGDALTYIWNFGDGATASGGPSQSHTYPTAGTYTVTVTVSDGSLQSSATTTATIAHVNRAPVAALAGLVSSNEGSSVAFSAAGSIDPDGDGLTYSWSFGDGASASSGPGQSHVYRDNGTYTVTVTVSDGSLQSSATTSVSVANVSPVVTISTWGATLLPGEKFTGSGGFTDPGADTWTATADYGDGTGSASLPLTGKTFALGHRYTTSGVFTVTATVGDDDAGTGSAQVTVTVQTPQRALQELLASLARLAAAGAVTTGEATSLAAPVKASIAQLDRGNAIPAANQLRAFLNHLNAMVRSGRLSRAEADRLAAMASRVLGSIA
jgi:PKD repeat protein